MKANLLSPIDWFEQWDFRNPDTTGIGGSETAHIELAWRLARRGWDVTSYAPIPADCPSIGPHGVKWIHHSKADLASPGLWLIYRSLKVVDDMPGTGQHIWIILEDVDCPGEFTEERCEKIEYVIALCHDHASHLIRKYPYATKKIIVGANGIRRDLIEQVEKERIERNPKRLMFASSPDRGLLEMLKIFRRAREQDYELELHAFYGMKRWDVPSISSNKAMSKTRSDIEKWLDQPGVFWHQGLNQVDLCREWFKSGIWCHPTDFTETSCITCMDAQACGAIPITRPLWALRTNVRSGIFIEGSPKNDLLVRSRYVDAVLRLAANPAAQAQIRPAMMMTARTEFSWERWTDYVEGAALVAMDSENYVRNMSFASQCVFQLKHSRGRTLNVGSDIDAPGFRFHKDTVNVDYQKNHPNIDELKRHVDVVADARALPETLHGKFDSVVLGEILEHMSDDDIVKSLKQAKLALSNGGPVVITWPEEDGSNTRHERETLHYPAIENELDIEYAPGCSAYHSRIITLDHMKALLNRAGMTPEFVQPIEYTTYNGWGVVAR